MTDPANPPVEPRHAISRGVGQVEAICSRLLMLAFLCAAASILLMPEVLLPKLDSIADRLGIVKHGWLIAVAVLAFIA
jgi:hypothetical protein